MDPTGHSACTPEDKAAGECSDTDDGKANTKAAIQSSIDANLGYKDSDPTDAVSNVADAAEKTLLDSCSKLSSFSGGSDCVSYDTLSKGEQRFYDASAAVANSAATGSVNPYAGLVVTVVQGAYPEITSPQGRMLFASVQANQALEDAKREANRMVMKQIMDSLNDAFQKLRTHAVMF